MTARLYSVFTLLPPVPPAPASKPAQHARLITANDVFIERDAARNAKAATEAEKAARGAERVRKAAEKAVAAERRAQAFANSFTVSPQFIETWRARIALDQANGGREPTPETIAAQLARSARRWKLAARRSGVSQSPPEGSFLAMLLN